MIIENWFNTEEIKRFYCPAKIFIGQGIFQQAITLCNQTKGPIVVIIDQNIYDMGFVKNALKSLSKSTIGTMVVPGIPITQEVESFVQSLSDRPSTVLAIGGGSATDFAKAVISLILFGGIDGIGLYGITPTPLIPSKPLLITVPTTAGSGAEASRYYVTYDKFDHHKVFGKSWSLVADWIMLDPIFFNSMPTHKLVLCSFDAFVHLFETFVCQHEKSWISQMFALQGIPHLMEALNQIIHEQSPSEAAYIALMETATIGGVAISNVRTGHIHEAAGALFEVTGLSHAETLYVFFRDAIDQYLDTTRNRIELLISHLRLKTAFAHFTSITDVISWWEIIFERLGLETRIRHEISSLKTPLKEARDHIFQRIFSDKVWITKECPVVLTEEAIWNLIDSAFKRFGIAERV